jgi:hypothetical protein
VSVKGILLVKLTVSTIPLISGMTNVYLYGRIIEPRQNLLKCGNGDGKAWPRKYPTALEINRAKYSALSRKRPFALLGPGVHRDARKPPSISRD